jgi:superfamily II DNA or RNA helicase
MPGYYFSPAFKAGRWDGRKHLYHPATASVPSGLVQSVVEALKAHDEDAKVQVIDSREEGAPAIAARGFELEGIDFGKGRYDFQMEAAEAMVRLKRCILKAATNSGKSECAAAVAQHLSVPTVFIVPGIDLLRQSHKRFAKRLGLDPSTIGFIGEGRWEVGEWITVASVDTLHSKLSKNKEEFLETASKWECMFLDECHSAGSDTHYAVADAIPAYYRYGLSGTPLDRSDGADLRLIAQVGEVGYEVSNKTLIERGISVQPYIEMVKITEPKLPPKTPWATVNKIGIVENEHLNSKVVQKVEEASAQDLRVMVMVDKIKHGKILSEMLDATGVSYKFLSGKESGDTREEFLEKFTNGVIECLVVTTIFDQGMDTPAIDVLIFAGGGKAKIRSLQRIGRGLRSGEGKEKLTVVDFAHFSHKYLTKHSLQRLATYKQENCFMISAHQ